MGERKKERKSFCEVILNFEQVHLLGDEQRMKPVVGCFMKILTKSLWFVLFLFLKKN